MLYALVLAAFIPLLAHGRVLNGVNTAECQVSNFRTQENFDLAQFMGRWFITSDVGLFPGHHSLDHLFYMAQDFKVYYTPLPDNKFQVYAGGRMAGFCKAHKTWGEIDRQGNQSSKLVTYFPVSLFSTEKFAQPYWVAYTDYEVALIYSCRKVAVDGACDPSEQYAWTLSRKTTPDTPEQTAALHQAMSRYCLQPASFIAMPRDRPCEELHPNF